MEKTKYLIIIGFILFLTLSLSCGADTAKAFTPILSVTARTETTVTLSWTKSTDTTFDDYFVASSTSPNGPFNDVAIIGNSSLTDFAVTYLTQNTTYYFIVRDKGSNGGNVSTTASNVCQVTTTSPPQLSFSSSSSTSVTLTWTDNNTYTSVMPFYDYVVQMSLASNSSQFSTVATINNPSQKHCTVKGLNPGTSYSFLVYDEVGASGQNYTPSNTISASTLAGSAVPEFPSSTVWLLLAITFVSVLAFTIKKKSLKK